MKHRILICTLLAVMLPLVVFAQPKPVKVTKPAVAKPATAVTPAVATPQPAPPPPPLAVVNGSPVAQGHLDQAIANRWGGPIMRAIIDDRLVRQEARRLGIKATPEEVGARLKIARDKYSSEAAFQRNLLAQGLTTTGFTEKLTTDILLDKLLANASAVTAQEAQKYYEANKSEYSSPAEIHLFTVTTGTIEDAYLVRERLAAGEKFEAIAKELSLDTAKESGGDNGWLRAANLPERPYADTLFAMEPGVVSSPLRVGGKYVIALVKERKPEQMISFQQAQKDIVAGLQAQKAMSRDEYLRMLGRRADITVNWVPAKYLGAEFARLREIQVIVDDEPLELATPPVRLPDGAILLPAKPVLQAVGANLVWNAADQSLTATSPAGKIKLIVGARRAIIGAATLEAKDMPVAPVMREGVLYISPRVPLDALGATLNWNARENALIIETIAKDMPSPTVPANRSGLEKQP